MFYLQMKRFLLVIRTPSSHDFKSSRITFEILNAENERNLIHIKSVKILFKKKIQKDQFCVANILPIYWGFFSYDLVITELLKSLIHKHNYTGWNLTETPNRKKRLDIVSFDWATFYNFFSKIDLVTLKIPRLFQNIIWEGNGNNRLLSLSTHSILF